MTDATTLTRERADLIESLDRHRYFLRFAVRGLSDEQAALRPTVSALSLGALIKHVTATEAAWVRFIRGGAEAMGGGDAEAWAREWRVEPGETLDGLLAQYEAVAGDTDELVATLPDLDAAHPLPEAPWFAPGASWSARRGCCTSSRRPPSTPGTPTSSGRPSTGRRPWAEAGRALRRAER